MELASKVINAQLIASRRGLLKFGDWLLGGGGGSWVGGRDGDTRASFALEGSVWRQCCRAGADRVHGVMRMSRLAHTTGDVAGTGVEMHGGDSGGEWREDSSGQVERDEERGR